MQDYDFLYQSGVCAIFGPGTRIPHAALEVIDNIEKKLKNIRQAMWEKDCCNVISQQLHMWELSVQNPSDMLHRIV